MMAKLTLSINEKTIEKAKRISRKRGKSISKMVEEYLDSISEKDEKKESAVDKIRKIMKDKISAPQLDWKKVKEERISKKYGV
jgi:Family of unknown function (DUF6364)